METNELDFSPPIKVGGRKSFYADEITFLEANINYTKIFLTDGSNFLSSTTLGILEKRLKNLHFFRPNRSYLINLHFAKFHEESSELNIRNEHFISVSRRKKPLLIKTLEMYFNV